MFPEGDALKEAILKQVEFYFSQQNLATDGFLVSQMDENRYVLLSLIASFTKLKAITTDINLIIESLKNSTIVELSPDNQKIKPKESKKRNTLILHNLPEGTTDEVPTFLPSFFPLSFNRFFSFFNCIGIGFTKTFSGRDFYPSVEK